MENQEQPINGEHITLKEFFAGVPDNLHYEYNYLKGLSSEEMKQSVKSILIGLVVVAIGAAAVLIPTCLQ